MAISRVTAVWSGFPGAPGYSNFYFRAFGGGDLVQAEVDRVHAFFDFITNRFPTGLSITVQQEVAIIDEVTGELISYAMADEAPGSVSGVAPGEYSAPSGAAVTWLTDDVARGRRLRGRTFLVPLSGGSYQDDGTLASNALTGINGAANILIGDGSGPQLVVWSRPRDGSDGVIGDVVGHRVPDMAAILRSRRD